MAKIKIEKIEDETEREILQLIEDEGKCSLGEILMKLQISNRNGYRYLNSLLDKRWISNTENPPYLTLKVDLE